MVELRDVRKSYGAVLAVDGISFAAREGEIFGLLGPNGAGKSTTIKMIMNILAPDSGSILFDGKPVREADKDRIGYLPEERGLYRKVKVGEMLLYFAALKNADPAASRTRMDAWLERFGLSEWRDRKAEELSKGMAQKVQFIAAVLHDPRLLFLDEPFAGLDPLAMDTLREAILELGRGGRTILFSTHNMDVAERLCSRILIVDHGREVVSGALEEVKAGHGTRSVVVEFDGDAGFLSGLPRVAAGIRRFPRWLEVELAPGASPDDLLRALVGRVSVRRFEVTAPSLHRIFVERVGGKDAAEGIPNE